MVVMFANVRTVTQVVLKVLKVRCLATAALISMNVQFKTPMLAE